MSIGKILKMSIKLALLKTGETIISDAKELVFEETKQVQGYLFKNPIKVALQRSIFLTEEDTKNLGEEEVGVVFSTWMPLTSDREFYVTPNWVVTIMEPLSSVKEMYEDRMNGKDS
jgi:hypothetical protein